MVIDDDEFDCPSDTGLIQTTSGRGFSSPACSHDLSLAVSSDQIVS